MGTLFLCLSCCKQLFRFTTYFRVTCLAPTTCIDGYCCNKCDFPCASCAIPPFEGYCTQMPRYSKDIDSCGTQRVCDARGQCRLDNGHKCTWSTECASLLCLNGLCSLPPSNLSNCLDGTLPPINSKSNFLCVNGTSTIPFAQTFHGGTLPSNP